jgi:hypothetical protein
VHWHIVVQTITSKAQLGCLLTSDLHAQETLQSPSIPKPKKPKEEAVATAHSHFTANKDKILQGSRDINVKTGVHR